jgi:predicted nucleotidyltransferase component of viral defense system
MKDEALAIVADVHDPGRKLNILREYLQSCALRSLHESEAFLNLSFVGGTALRFLFNLPRFSEDLDFSLEAPDGYEGERWMKKLKTDLELAGFETWVRWNSKTTVHKAWIRVGEILHDTGLAAMREQKLSIKLEIDTRPPSGAVRQRTIVTRHRILALQHHDLPSLFAGKIHALMTRGYPKGRDWYDLLWYMGQRPRPEPNLIQLQNALDQTQGKGGVDAKDWRTVLNVRFDALDVIALAEDVAPFLERPSEADLLSRDNICHVLQS